jgi:hypothetical protein
MWLQTCCLAIVVSSLGASVGFAQLYSDVVQADQPRVYWRFDNDLADAMGNVNLDPAAAPEFVDGPGTENQAYSSNEGQAWAAAFGVVDLNGLETFTYEMWINLTGDNEGKYILQRIGLGENSPGENSLLYRNGGIEFVNTGPGVLDDVPFVELADETDAWHHLVVVHDYEEAMLFIYLDGVEAFAVGAYLSPFFGGNSDELYIGANRVDPEGVVMNGEVDEVAIYGKALTPEEVSAHFNAAFPGDYPAAIEASEPLSYWRFEGNYQDEMNRYNLLPSGVNFVDGAGGAPNKALFGRVTSHQAQVLYEEMDSFTYEFWFNPIGLSAQSYIFFRNPGSEQHAVIYAYNPDALEFFFARDPSNAFIRPLVNIPNNTDQWYHCVVINDFDANQMRIYIDGELVNQTDDAHAVPGTGELVVVGGSDQGDNFNGYIDELAVYNYMLTEEQIQTHFSTPINAAVGEWSLH